MGEVLFVRRCGKGRNLAGPALIAAGAVLLLVALPMEFWLAAIGIALIVSGAVVLRVDRC